MQDVNPATVEQAASGADALSARYEEPPLLTDAESDLSRRLRALAEGMDLAVLYDEERELFRIGLDAESGRPSESHYDLYASEARILSFAAMMLGQAPAKHWSRLNRASVRAGKGQALLSWSGTMFEYLMPELLLRSPENTLAGQSRAGVAACQIRRGKRHGRPWGVSESGYFAFDGRLNYQYRAFGLPELALSGEAEPGVVAPYASALALCCAPGDAAENMRGMCAMGWLDEYGFYEAADYIHAPTAAEQEREEDPSTPDRAPKTSSGKAKRAKTHTRDRAAGLVAPDDASGEATMGASGKAENGTSKVRGKNDSPAHEADLPPRAMGLPSAVRRVKSGIGKRFGPSAERLQHETAAIPAPQLVRSHMAHHQGMTLCAICNALCDDVLSKCFMELPEARALRLLLQERPCEHPPRRTRSRGETARVEVQRQYTGFARGARTKNCAADVHLLHGANTTALVTARGTAFVWSEGLQLNRFSDELTGNCEGMGIRVEDARTGLGVAIGQSGRASFDAGFARFRETFEGLNLELKLAVSPEDGTLYQIVEIENPGPRPRELHVTGSFAAALAPQSDMRAHPIFQNLFVEGRRLSPRTLALHRRPRAPGTQLPDLRYQVSGGEEPQVEMRLDRLTGRMCRPISMLTPHRDTEPFATGEMREERNVQAVDSRQREARTTKSDKSAVNPGNDSDMARIQTMPAHEIADTGSFALDGTAYSDEVRAADHRNGNEMARGQTGIWGKWGAAFDDDAGAALLDPCAALRVRVNIEANSVQSLYFALSLARAGERERAGDAAERALGLAEAQARTALTHAGLDHEQFVLYQRAAALLFDAKLRQSASHEAQPPVNRRALWSAGVSGELPVLLVELATGAEERPCPQDAAERLNCAREGLRLHAFYRSMGVAVDLVLLDARAGDYRHNVGGELGGLLAANQADAMMDAPGGIHILDAAKLSEEACQALSRVAALRLRAGSDPLTQLRSALQILHHPTPMDFRPLPPVARPQPEGLQAFNDFGGYRDGEYVILLRGPGSEREALQF